MTDRTPPNDTQAEACVLGSCLLSTHAFDDARAVVTADDFYRPAHALVWNTIEALRGAGEPVDEVTVIAALQERGTITQAGGPLGVHALVEAVPTAASAGYYARIVRDRAVLRNVITAATRAVQLAENPAGDDAHTIADQAAGMLTQVRDQGMLDEDLPTLNIDEFLAVEIQRNWLVPGLLERGDRLMLTGAEGLGKSEITRQIALCVAAGLHPFTHTRGEPARVLVVDLENSMALGQRRYQRLTDAARKTGGPVDSSKLWIEARPAGLDVVAHPPDVRWLLRRVDVIQPDLLVVGPVYRMHTADPNDEQTARRVAAVLDRCRAASGCAVVTENHSPHGSGITKHRPIRPVGSSLWLRWPEFGYGIRLADEDGAAQRRLVDVVAWRGPREERQWPERLEAGHPWPWVEAYPAGFDPGMAGVA